MRLETLRGPVSALPVSWSLPAEPLPYRLGDISALCDSMLLDDGFLRLTIFTPDLSTRFVVNTPALPTMFGGAPGDQFIIAEGVQWAGLVPTSGVSLPRTGAAPLPRACWVAPGETLLLETMHPALRLTLTRYIE